MSYRMGSPSSLGRRDPMQQGSRSIWDIDQGRPAKPFYSVEDVRKLWRILQASGRATEQEIIDVISRQDGREKAVELVRKALPSLIKKSRSRR